MGQLEESFQGFGEELKAALPGLAEDGALLARSRRELASLAMRLCDSAQNDLILTLLSFQMRAIIYSWPSIMLILDVVTRTKL